MLRSAPNVLGKDADGAMPCSRPIEAVSECGEEGALAGGRDPGGPRAEPGGNGGGGSSAAQRPPSPALESPCVAVSVARDARPVSLGSGGVGACTARVKKGAPPAFSFILLPARAPCRQNNNNGILLSLNQVPFYTHADSEVLENVPAGEAGGERAAGGRGRARRAGGGSGGGAPTRSPVPPPPPGAAADQTLTNERLPIDV